MQMVLLAEWLQKMAKSFVPAKNMLQFHLLSISVSRLNPIPPNVHFSAHTNKVLPQLNNNFQIPPFSGLVDADFYRIDKNKVFFSNPP